MSRIGPWLALLLPALCAAHALGEASAAGPAPGAAEGEPAAEVSVLPESALLVLATIPLVLLVALCLSHRWKRTRQPPVSSTVVGTDGAPAMRPSGILRTGGAHSTHSGAVATLGPAERWMIQESSFSAEPEPPKMEVKPVRERASTMWTPGAGNTTTGDKGEKQGGAGETDDYPASNVPGVVGLTAGTDESATTVTETSFGDSTVQPDDIVILRPKKNQDSRKKSAVSFAVQSMYSPTVRVDRDSIAIRESMFGPAVRQSVILKMDQDVSTSDDAPDTTSSKIKRLTSAGPVARPDGGDSAGGARVPGSAVRQGLMSKEDIDRAIRIADARKLKLPPRVMNYLLSVDCIILGKKLSSDYFGNVHDATLLSSLGKSNEDEDGFEDAGDADTPVVVNLLTREFDARCCQSYVNEASVLLSMQHPNILRIFGVYIEPSGIGIVSESLPMSSVRDWLLQIRKTPSMTWGTILPVLVDLSRQAACGLECLEKKNIVHRDLTARNLLLSDSLVVKIGDFGVARSVRGTIMQGGEVLRPVPLRWMAPECIQSGKFSNKGVVWAFGVVLWEFISLGSVPLGHIRDVREYFRSTPPEDGEYLPREPRCPDALHEIMASCWRTDPAQRPGFKAIIAALDEAHEQIMSQQGMFSSNSFARQLLLV
uniref:Protein tyrosine kinase n=1 Tax=Monosiga ovata TaxID=81526 RepID=B3XVW4_9EUKA|nr:protein tyrosine kinase [Monosiga ovata]